mmetsp:Transcript_51571/g.144101  ORF Transcript_51571/g.144101 Transcript_51571/m.144101 type:complete len:217 (-) Transcript_51571:76-726(-)
MANPIKTIAGPMVGCVSIQVCIVFSVCRSRTRRAECRLPAPPWCFCRWPARWTSTCPKAKCASKRAKKSSGPGGQSVNAMTQAIRVVHIPTGISTYCASTQSLIDNRNRALEMLRTKLLSQQLAARSDFERNERKSQRGTGDRSEKIRTYNFQRDEVTDHLLGKAAGQKYSAEDILFGDGLEGLLAAHRARVRTEELENAVKAIEARMGASSAAER